MLVYIDRSAVLVVLQFVMDVLKIADKHNGMCMGKFAYDVLSKIRNKRYNNVLFNDTVTIMFTHENGVTQFLKECMDVTIMTTDDDKYVIIDRNGSYIIGVELVVGAPQLTFVNHDCRFDMSSMTVVHNKWPAANFARMMMDCEYQYADGYNYQSLSMSDIWTLIQRYPNAKFYNGRQLLFARQIPPRTPNKEIPFDMVVSADGSFYYNNSMFNPPTTTPTTTTPTTPTTTPTTPTPPTTTPPTTTPPTTTPPTTTPPINWNNLRMANELITSMLHLSTVCDSNVSDTVCDVMYSEVCKLLLPTTH